MNRSTVILAVFMASLSLNAATLGIKNFREIYLSLLTSMNLKPDATLDKAFQDAVNQLPKFGKVGEYSSPMQLSTLKLASEICSARIQLDAKASGDKRWLFKIIDFSKEPKTLSAKERESVAKDLAAVFWQRDLTQSEASLLDANMQSLASQGTSLKMDAYLTFLCAGFGVTTDFLAM